MTSAPAPSSVELADHAHRFAHADRSVRPARFARSVRHADQLTDRARPMTRENAR
ncbi:hypothetical protein [Kitasatospora griseola]|uniref:hypothetical protein n=1 Tax=Kitasatospora griseola TaxID=2064 RepID=UPI00380B4875